MERLRDEKEHKEKRKVEAQIRKEEAETICGAIIC